jgi:hypothetical protein
METVEAANERGRSHSQRALTYPDNARGEYFGVDSGLPDYTSLVETVTVIITGSNALVARGNVIKINRNRLFNELLPRLGFALLFTIAGCVLASAPLKNTPKVVASPEPGQLSVAIQPADTVGQVQPLYVSIANGTDVPRSIVPSQIFALDDQGQRIAPLPPGEAARQAGGAGELKAALASGAASGAITGALGAGVGAIAGSLIHSGASGAAIGGAIGAGEGALQGAFAGPNKAHEQANEQMTALALEQGDVRNNFTVSGYVFFPKGNYRQVQLLLVDSESGNTEVIERPWK